MDFHANLKLPAEAIAQIACGGGGQACESAGDLSPETAESARQELLAGAFCCRWPLSRRSHSAPRNRYR